AAGRPRSRPGPAGTSSGRATPTIRLVLGSRASAAAGPLRPGLGLDEEGAEHPVGVDGRLPALDSLDEVDERGRRGRGLRGSARALDRTPGSLPRGAAAGG